MVNQTNIAAEYGPVLEQSVASWFICGSYQDQQVNFLTCWDDASGTSQAKATACAKTAGLDMAPITKCATGDKAEALQLVAAGATDHPTIALLSCHILRIPSCWHCYC